VASRTRFFDALPPETRRHVLAQGVRRRFTRREIIFHEGDSADSLHVIDRGHVAVRVTTRRGDSAMLDVLGPGDALGELAVLPPRGSRSATAIALEDTQTLLFSADVFTSLRQSHAEAVELLLAILVERNRALTSRLLDALFEPVDTRLVRRLLQVDAHYGRGRDAPAALPLTQEDVASLAGTTRESANRLLRRLADDGLVVLGRGSITIPERELLGRRAL